MSGTSLDGVDAALVSFDYSPSKTSSQPQVLQTHFLPYSSSLREQVLALQHPTHNELEVTQLLSNQLAKLYAEAVNQLLANAKVTAKHITAIGCHGQTIRHCPGFSDGIGFTLQIGNPALLAELTNITVISDFRSRDIAAGGQGAPLVPAFHQALFSDKQVNRALINIGGIANITYLPNNGEVLGFDSGPGNMLLDAWVKQHQNLDYDADGAWAGTGQVVEILLNKMLEEPYFSSIPPKSTGRDLFNNQWLERCLTKMDFPPQDIARTLIELTARTIHDALTTYCHQVDEVFLCGGGAHNGLLRERLQTLLGSKKLATTESLGVGVDWVEAIAFAWLAKQCLDKKTANLPEVTGAIGPRILGAIYQK